jgi:hypothetical protein
MAEEHAKSEAACEAFCGRIRIRLQPSEHGGFAVEFADKHTGESLATKYILESNLAKARPQALDRARELLSAL